MLTKVLAAGVMAVAAVAMTGAALAPAHADVLAGPICAQVTTTGVLPANVGPACVPYPLGVNCQTTTVSFAPTIGVTVYACVPRP